MTVKILDAVKSIGKLGEYNVCGVVDNNRQEIIFDRQKIIIKLDNNKKKPLKKKKIKARLVDRGLDDDNKE